MAAPLFPQVRQSGRFGVGYGSFADWWRVQELW